MKHFVNLCNSRRAASILACSWSVSAPILSCDTILVPGGIIEDSDHGHNAIGGAIGASDVSTDCPDVVNGQSNAAC